MDLDDYNYLYKILDSKSDIQQISKSLSIPPGVVSKIWEQKMVDKSKKDFIKIEKNSNFILKKWLFGKSFVEISKQYNISPVLVSNAILKKLEFTKKEIKRFNKNPNSCHNKRISGELKEVSKTDFMFSHKANKRSDDMGKAGEILIQKFLCEQNIDFLDENHLRKKKYKKTPDFLFETPQRLSGSDIYWIDSKMLFGNFKNHRKHRDSQFTEYTDLFGPGLVVYWFGFINELNETDEVKEKKYILKDYNLFKDIYPNEIEKILNYIPS
ncbi:MAG: TPD domain-containing protein [Methanosarcinaceae archaeon]|nr:TPD domain-containing protein [Methanosarcinaceae archaeon]